MKNIFIVLTLISSLGLSRCAEFEIKPPDLVAGDSVFISSQNFQKVLNGIYDVVRGNGGSYMGGRAQVFGELMTSNVVGEHLTGDVSAVHKKSTTFFNGSTSGLYTEAYLTIQRANTMLNEVDSARGSTISEEQADRTIGESKFLRALSYFTLIRFYGEPFRPSTANSTLGVPIRLDGGTGILFRSSVADTYNQIIADLRSSADLLADVNNPYGFANQYSAEGYLAQVYFQMNNFDSAYFYANKVIETSGLALDDSLEDRYSSGKSTEGVFIMPSLGPQDHRGVGLSNEMRSDINATPTVRFSQELFDLISSNPADRRINFLNDTGEDIVYTRINNMTFFDMPLLTLTELYLIRAESAAELGQNLSQAIADLQAIIDRAYGIGNSIVNPSSSAELIIERARSERRKEFFGEGVYFHDQRRIGALNEEEVIIGGTPWNCPDILLQFPANENVEDFTLNPRLGCA